MPAPAAPPPHAPPPPDRGSGPNRRVLAGLSAAVAGLIALIAGVLTLIVVLMATQVPDFYYDGGDLSDPPKTWGGAAGAVAWAGGMTLLVSAVAVIALALVAVAAGRRPPSFRSLAITSVTPPVIVVALLGVLLAANSGDARLAVDCDRFRFDGKAFRSDDLERRDLQAFGLQDCSTIPEGSSRTLVQELLGAPTSQSVDGQIWQYEDRVTVVFSGDRVERIRERVED